MDHPRRPPSAHLDDLAAPRFSPEAQSLRASMAEMAALLPLTPQALMDAASAQTGLHDFGDDWFREPLDVLCTALRTEADLSPCGEVSLAVQIIQGLVTRLRL